MKFSVTLKELREQYHVTQSELAEYLEVTRSTIAGYETKGKQPDFERLLQIADFFHVSADYLLTGCESSYSAPPDHLHSPEYEIVSTYRGLSAESRRQLVEYANLLQLKEKSLQQ